MVVGQASMPEAEKIFEFLVLKLRSRAFSGEARPVFTFAIWGLQPENSQNKIERVQWVQRSASYIFPEAKG